MADDTGGTNFMVDLAALAEAIGQISGERTTISGGITSLRTTFTRVEDHWQSPAGGSFGTLVTNFNRITDTMVGLLDEAIGKMQTAHDNYAAIEQANTDNLQNKAVPPGDPQDGPQNQPDQQPDAARPTARQQPDPTPTLARPTARQG